MTRPVYSWGHYPNAPQEPHACRWATDIPRMLQQQGETLAYGMGRSYGDSCLARSGHVLQMRGLDRLIQVDWTQGRIRAEAGITLSELLALTIPHGWFLSVTPGTGLATLGGAIANDVHGKNHHRRGTFGHHVLRLGLWRQGNYWECSAEQHPELFQATLGGLGLTGVILWAEIRLIPIQSSQVAVKTVRFNSVAEFFEVSAERDAQHEYSVAWVDCLATGQQTGRGVLMLGDHAPYGTLTVDEPARCSVPFVSPISLVNPWSARIFNALYWRQHPTQLEAQSISYAPFFYPLDRIPHWNRLYGRSGFQQYQCVIPEAVAEPVLTTILQSIAQSGLGSFLAVLKRCGGATAPGLLSFPLPGVSLALDFPQQLPLARLFHRLDALVHEAGGRLYPAKDAHMSGADFRRAYPAWERLEALRDPALNSRFWTRVTT